MRSFLWKLELVPNILWIVVASYRQMKYLDSNLVCVNVVSFSVGKQHDIAYEISERVGKTYKIKFVAAGFMNMNRWKEMLELHDQIFTISSS